MTKEDLLSDDNFVYAVISIPKNAVNIDIDCKVFDGENIKKMHGYLDMEEIREARKMYLELDPTDDFFTVYRLRDDAFEC